MISNHGDDAGHTHSDDVPADQPDSLTYY